MEKFISFSNKLKPSAGWPQTFPSSKAGWLVSFVLVLLTALANPVRATDFTNNYVFISGSRGGSPIATTQYYTKATDYAGSQPFQGQVLGQGMDFNRNQSGIDELFINAEANTITTGDDNIQAVQLLYRVYRADGADEPGNQIPLNLPLQSGSPDGLGNWQYLTNKTNLINFATSPGKYVVEVAFSAAVSAAGDAADQPPTLLLDDRGGQYYKATFNVSVNGGQYITLSWNPTTSTSGNTEWANSANWSPNVIPNTNTDVIIPYVKGGQYPTVGSNSNAATNSVHNLRISGKGNDASLGARLFLVGGSLAIFGNFQDINGGLAQSGTGVLYLSGQDQVFDASPSLNNLYIRGGGTKTLTGLITIANRIEFLGAGSGFAAGGILATSISNPNNFGVKLLADAVLAGETEGAYVRGSVNTTRSVTKNVRNTFGGIGLDLKTSADIGNLTVNRTSSIYEGAGTSVSINRGFTLFSSATDLVTTDLTFHYLNDELNDIDPVDLRLFSSETGDIPFVPLGKTSASITNKTLTRLAIKGSLQVTFTLGSVLNPLPVTLTSFTATPTAQGTALLRWATASETDNRGFNIERQLSTDGSWTTVGFVAAGATTGSAYEYVDKSLASAPASDKVYYRLRQEDLNGKTSYSPVAAINRQAAVAATELTLSPVPVSGSNLTLTLAEVGQAGIEVAIINTQGQRLTNFTTEASTDAALSLPVANLAAGVYIVSVQVPGQAVRRARFVKL